MSFSKIDTSVAWGWCFQAGGRGLLRAVGQAAACPTTWTRSTGAARPSRAQCRCSAGQSVHRWHPSHTSPSCSTLRLPWTPSVLHAPHTRCQQSRTDSPGAPRGPCNKTSMRPCLCFARFALHTMLVLRRLALHVEQPLTAYTGAARWPHRPKGPRAQCRADPAPGRSGYLCTRQIWLSASHSGSPSHSIHAALGPPLATARQTLALPSLACRLSPSRMEQH